MSIIKAMVGAGVGGWGSKTSTLLVSVYYTSTTTDISVVTHHLSTLSADNIDCDNIHGIMGICKTISSSYRHIINECFSKFQSDFINDLMMETSSYNLSIPYWIGLNQRRGGM